MQKQKRVFSSLAIKAAAVITVSPCVECTFFSLVVHGSLLSAGLSLQKQQVAGHLLRSRLQQMSNQRGKRPYSFNLKFGGRVGFFSLQRIILYRLASFLMC